MFSGLPKLVHYQWRYTNRPNATHDGLGIRQYRTLMFCDKNILNKMKTITLAKLRDGEINNIAGFGEVHPGRLFNFKYFKDDTIGIIINGSVYPEVSTAFDFVKVKLPPAIELYNMIESLVSNVVNYNDYSGDIAKMTDFVTGIERA